MKQITKKKLKEIILKELLENISCDTDESNFIISINGLTIYYSDYRIYDITDDDFSITFDGWYGEICTCKFYSYSTNYIYFNGLMYEII